MGIKYICVETNFKETRKLLVISWVQVEMGIVTTLIDNDGIEHSRSCEPPAASEKLPLKLSAIITSSPRKASREILATLEAVPYNHPRLRILPSKDRPSYSLEVPKRPSRLVQVHRYTFSKNWSCALRRLPT